MERLNEILGKTPRRQPSTEPRSSQGAAIPGQPQSPLTRRPQMQEPMARQGQRYPTSNNGYAKGPQESGYGAARTRPMYPQKAGEQTSRPPTYGGAARNAQATYGSRQPVDSALHSRTDYPASRPQPHQDMPRMQPLQPRPSNDYYPLHVADDYTSKLPADAIDEWEEDGLVYEDWETEDSDVLEYEEETVEIVEEEEESYSAPRHRTRQPLSREETPGHPTSRLLNEVQTPLQRSGATFTRTTGEKLRPQRTTQPLDAQIANRLMHNEAAPAVRQTDPRLVRPLRALQQVEPLPQTMPTPKVSKGVCQRCKGAGWLRANVPYGDPNFGKPIACQCKEFERTEKRRQQLREMSNMDAFHDQDFGSYNAHIPGVREAFQAALEFAEDPAGWLLMVGPNGCGKTHLAAAIANQRLDSGSVVLFEAVPDLLDHLRAAFAPTANEVYDQLFAKMREAEVLILDDLGAQQSSPWANEKLFQLLNYRYNMEMPTVITANMKGIQGIDERIRSRLGDSGLVRMVNMDRTKDYRPTNVRKR